MLDTSTMSDMEPSTSTAPSAVKPKRAEDDIDDNYGKWENHFLLRVPPEHAESVREFCNDSASTHRLSVNFDEDLRRGTFNVDDTQLHFINYDLPCIVEVLCVHLHIVIFEQRILQINKTLDNVNLYNCGHLSQMLRCTTEPITLAEPQRDRSYFHPHGLAASLKNVRKKRFRKTIKKKYMDAPEVEKEVKRLLRFVAASIKH